MAIKTAIRLAAILTGFAASSCTDVNQVNGSLLQPQTTDGSCTVKKFYLVRLSTTHTDMTVATGGQACQITLINPDQQIVNDAALVTERPTHGVARATLIAQGRSVAVSYSPAPGYQGNDTFEVTIQPQARGITFAVTVQPTL